MSPFQLGQVESTKPAPRQEDPALEERPDPAPSCSVRHLGAFLGEPFLHHCVTKAKPTRVPLCSHILSWVLPQSLSSNFPFDLGIITH